MKRNIVQTVAFCVAAFVLAAVVSSPAEQLQERTIYTPSSIAAWQSDIFVLRGIRLLKLNSELEVVKSIEIPSTGAPVPREPPIPGEPVPPQPPELPEPPTRAPSTASPTQKSAAVAGPSGVAADSGYVYVLSGAAIHVLDHDLIYLKSGILE